MRLGRFWHSLRFKITAGIALPLLVILSAFSVLQYIRQRDLLLSNLDQQTTNLGNVIVGSLEHAMLSQDLPEIQSIVGNIAEQQGIRDVFVINRRGEIRFTPQSDLMGTSLTVADSGCIECHGAPFGEHPFNTIFTNSAGQRLFRNCKPILNRPKCQTCHNPADKFNGVLITDLSMEPIDQLLAADLRTNILWSSVAILATILVLNALMSRVVVTRLERLVQVIKRFSRGDLSQRARLASDDEIGDLATSFNRMAQQVAEHTQELERLNDELRRKENLRGQLMVKLITAQEEERKRIARDLHDDLGQALSAMTMGMEAAERALPPEQSALKERLVNAHNLATRALEQTHELILDLRPVVLDDLGLIAAIRSYAEQHLMPREIEVDLCIRGTTRRLAPELEIAIFRIVQEGINNIAKHANARRVKLALEFAETIVRVTLQDDGRGFWPDSIFNEQGHGYGLLGMRERAVLAEGNLTVHSAPGQGTRIVVAIPAPAIDGKAGTPDTGRENVGGKAC